MTQQELALPESHHVTARRARSARRRFLGIAATVVVVIVAIGAVVGVVAQSDDATTKLVDTFDRADRTDGLGSARNGPQWSHVTGKWGIAHGSALVTEAGPPANLAVAAMPSADGTVRVRMGHVSAGSGLVFRYDNPTSYWEIVAYPAYLTWQIAKVQDGLVTAVTNTGPYSPVDDSTVVTVRNRGSSFSVSLNGRVRRSVLDAYLANANGAGLIASGKGATDARFARVEFEG